MAKRYSQPQGNARIDWGNPTSRSLAFAWDAASKSMELTAGLSAGLDQTSSAVNKNGLAAQCSSGQKNIEWNKQFITTSDGTGGGDFTMLVVADPAATGAGSAEHVFDQKNDAAGAPYAQVGLLAHSGARGAYTSGAFSFFTYRSTDSEVSAAGACDGLEHVWIGVRRAGTLYLYKDGVLLASGAGFNGSLNISQASRYTAVGSAGNATAGAYRNKASMARAWNRALSAAEIAEQTSLARFSLYQPQARIWVPVAAGGDTYTLTADSGSFALTGQDTALNFNRTLAADSGSFALTGQAAALLQNRVLAADSGPFALAGQDATLTYTPTSTATYTLAAASGSFAVSGQDVVLAYNRVLSAANGSYLLTGQNATLVGPGLFTQAQLDYMLAYCQANMTGILKRWNGSAWV